MRNTLTTQLKTVGIGVTALLVLSSLFGIPPLSAQTNLELNWSADVLVPAGYRGRALPSPDSTITVVARNVSPALEYVWEVNGTRYNNESGIGRTSFSFEAPFPPATTTEVRLMLRDGRGTIDEAVLAIPIVSPVITIRGASADGIVRTLHNRDEFAIPVGSTQFHFQPHFLPTSWLNESFVSWAIGDELSTGALERFTVADFSVSNRSAADLTAPLRIELRSSTGTIHTSFLQLIINGVDVPSL